MNREVTYNNHGGGCCGMSHLFGFGYGDMSADGVLRINNDPFPGGSFEYTRLNGRCLEVVLTDEQINNMPGVVRRLKDQGFELVNRFYNSNSSNYCNVLHLTRSSEEREALMKDSPFHATTPAIEAAEPDTAVVTAVPVHRTVENQRLNGHDGRRVFVVTGNGAPMHHHYPIGAYVFRVGRCLQNEGLASYALTEPSLDCESTSPLFGTPPSQYIHESQLRPYVPGESRDRV